MEDGSIRQGHDLDKPPVSSLRSPMCREVKASETSDQHLKMTLWSLESGWKDTTITLEGPTKGQNRFPPLSGIIYASYLFSCQLKWSRCFILHDSSHSLNSKATKARVALTFLLPASTNLARPAF